MVNIAEVCIMDRDIKTLISEMTLEEKASLCSGRDCWFTRSIERLGIPSIMMSDGPHGLRKLPGEREDLDQNTSIPATCFPAEAALACSWDRSLVEEIGAALGDECLSENVSILLGPAANIKRSPLCGRNFEYLSEDPYLSAELAASYIKGVQSRGVGTSLKHFAANNQETRRFLADARVDERTLREIYLASFEGAVKQSHPWTVMCAYNKINGQYCSENKTLLTDILKKEWGHEGFVVSDWGAVNERVDGLAAGLDLEMPSSGGDGDKKIIDAVRSGKLPESVLDAAVERLLKVILRAASNLKKDTSCDRDAHHLLARKAAGECAVLLKNDGELLPLKKGGTIAVIGGFAKEPRFQGGGSSNVNPLRTENAFDEMIKMAGPGTNIVYAQGYRTDKKSGVFTSEPFRSQSDTPDQDLIREAVKIAEKSDVAVIFAGLPENYECEGFDRKHMMMPEGHSKLIEAVAEVQENTVVVLSNGAPVEMPWIGKVKAVLEMYLGGQASGGAAADILFGVVNPSGKLAETFPVKLSDNPSFLNFPGDLKKVEYREGLFVGYRYYDAAQVEPLFPFGHGLSYTKFEYTAISADKKEIKDTDELHVSVSVKNTGSVAGKEIVQLYVRDDKSSVIRPYKELKGFEKTYLEPGEEKTVVFTLGRRAFAYYSTEKKDWYVEDGDFTIMAGRSSRKIEQEITVHVSPSVPEHRIFTRNSTVSEVLAVPQGRAYLEEVRKSIFGEEGGAVPSLDEDDPTLAEMPLRQLMTFNHEAFNEEKLQELLEILNKG